MVEAALLSATSGRGAVSADGADSAAATSAGAATAAAAAAANVSGSALALDSFESSACDASSALAASEDFNRFGADHKGMRHEKLSKNNWQQENDLTALDYQSQRECPQAKLCQSATS
jgi:hypothetical protein